MTLRNVRKTLFSIVIRTTRVEEVEKRSSAWPVGAFIVIVPYYVLQQCVPIEEGAEQVPVVSRTLISYTRSIGVAVAKKTRVRAVDREEGPRDGSWVMR